MDCSVCEKDLEDCSMNVGEWYRVPNVLLEKGYRHLVRSISAIREFIGEIPWSHHSFYMKWSEDHG